MEITSPLIYGVPCFVAFIIGELLYTKTLDKSNSDLYDYKDLRASSLMGLGSVILAPIVKFFILGSVFETVFLLCNTKVPGTEDIYVNFLGYESFDWNWYVFLICQFGDDLSYYWVHRFNHTVRFMWAAHIVHHSSHNFNFGTGIRNGWFTLLYKPLFYCWLPALGFPPSMVIFCLGIEALWQFQLHTKYVPNLGFLELVLNTHTQHQVHHAQNVEYLDKNHGGYLNLFDKIFGTWAPLENDKREIQYGVIHPPETNNPFDILLHEYKNIWADVKNTDNWMHKFMYIFGEPGWSPDGSTLTVKQMQSALAKAELHEPPPVQLQKEKEDKILETA